MQWLQERQEWDKVKNEDGRQNDCSSTWKGGDEMNNMDREAKLIVFYKGNEYKKFKEFWGDESLFDNPRGQGKISFFSLLANFPDMLKLPKLVISVALALGLTVKYVPLNRKYDFPDLIRCPVCHSVLKDDAPLTCRCGWKGEEKK